MLLPMYELIDSDNTYAEANTANTTGQELQPEALLTPSPPWSATAILRRSRI